MKQYICLICGYVYDEAKGSPESGVGPGTTWDKLPDGWVCPICGATKAEFQEHTEIPKVDQHKVVPSFTEAVSIPAELTPLEMSALCSNLARGCEKQYKFEEAQLFAQLAEYFRTQMQPTKAPDFEQLLSAVEQDLETRFPQVSAVATEAKDRGALRALVWSEKVTRILKSLLTRYKNEGDALFENADVYVCTICGYIHLGDTLPEVCPICKVPNWKLDKVEGRLP